MRSFVFVLLCAALALPATAAAGPRLSVAKVRAEAVSVGKEIRSHASTGVTGYYVAGCKRRSRVRAVCRLVLLSEGSKGPASCELPVMGVLKKGRMRTMLGMGDCLL